MKQNFLLLLALCLLSSCAKRELDLGKDAASYFAPLKSYQEGIVHKYYMHTIPNDKNASPSTDIQYFRYQFVEPDFLYCEVMDAAFEMTGHEKHQLKDGKMMLVEYETIYYGDTSVTVIQDNVELDWNSSEAVLNMQQESKKYKTLIVYNREQHSISDTIIEDIACKKVEWMSNSQVFSPTDTVDYAVRRSSFFAKGIGHFKELIITDKYQQHHELVEQMSISDFEKKKANAKKRIAYIDPAKRIDKLSEFKLCNDESSIGDYYNRKQRGELNGGKGAWWRILKRELNEDKLHKESGYLTYRFVLNCEGKTGWFITEQADLAFNKKEFNPETVEHLYQIVSKQKNWLITKNNLGTLDSYVYITFKLKDGKIIELLP